MKRTRTLRIWGGFWLLLLFLFTFLIWNIFAGSVSLSASEIWRILLGGDVDFTQSQIIMKIRLPRLLSALILGGALSLSGYLLQTFFHNPIAGPFVLGISSGAKMTVCVAMLALLSRGKTTSSAILIAAAFVGAMVSMGFVLLISQRVKRMSLLVDCGVMIGYLSSALAELLVTYDDESLACPSPSERTSWARSTRRTWASPCGPSGRRLSCCPACCPPASRPLLAPSPLSASQCRT